MNFKTNNIGIMNLINFIIIFQFVGFSIFFFNASHNIFMFLNID